MTTPDPAAIAPARATPSDGSTRVPCEQCRGSGRVPSRQVAGVFVNCSACSSQTTPCGRCKSTGWVPAPAYADANRHPCPACTPSLEAEKPEALTFRGVPVHEDPAFPAEAGGCEPPNLAERRHDDRTADDTQRALWLGVVIGLGLGAFVWLVVGIFARFPS